MIQNNNETQLIQNYLNSQIENIQNQYDTTITKIGIYYQDVKLVFHQYEHLYQTLSGHICGFLGELHEGIVLRMINDLEKFTKLFLEQQLGTYYKDDAGEQIDSSAGQTGGQVYKLKGQFKLYTNQYLKDYVLN